MEPETRTAWLIGLILLGAVAALFLFGRASEKLRPTPQRAWVAIETGGSGVARVGAVEVEAGGEYSLYAVLEAESWQGENLYYTEAERLELPEGPVAPERLRRWPGGDETRVLWFSVESSKRYLEISDAGELERIEYKEFFLPDWPRTWKVAGRWGRTSAGVTLPEGVKVLPFGTRRFQVSIEIFGPESEIRPRQRIKSWTGAELEANLEHFPTALSRLEGTLGPASVVFGLPQVELGPDAGAEAAAALAEWRRRRLAFSRLAVIKATLVAAEVDLEVLDWQAIELTGQTAWGGGADLLRVGDRWVVTYEDRGQPGALDYDDLCFDWDKGAAVRRLGDIFVGDGLVERARL